MSHPLFGHFCPLAPPTFCREEAGCSNCALATQPIFWCPSCDITFSDYASLADCPVCGAEVVRL